MKNQEITLDAYKDSIISKGFESQAFHKMETVVRDNFEKGLIDADTFEKALGELDMLKTGRKPAAVATPAETDLEKAEKGEDKKEDKKDEKVEDKKDDKAADKDEKDEKVEKSEGTPAETVEKIEKEEGKTK